jgi:hypothetical protein
MYNNYYYKKIVSKNQTLAYSQQVTFLTEKGLYKFRKQT